MIYGVLVLWGVGYAWWLQRSALGRRLVRYRAWVTVVIGVAGTLAPLPAVVGWRATFCVLAAFAASGMGIVARSQLNELRHLDELVATGGKRGPGQAAELRD